MTDYTISDARGRIIARVREHYDEELLENIRAGIRAKMKERGCDNFGELLEKIKEDEFQEEIRKRQRLKALGLLYPGE